jgi:membrane-bound ClpP family serine protease
MDLVQIGLPLIAVAWLVQLFFSFRGKNDIRPEFIILYMMGVLLLVIQDSTIGLTIWSYLEIGTMVAAGLVLVRRLWVNSQLS